MSEKPIFMKKYIVFVIIAVLCFFKIFAFCPCSHHHSDNHKALFHSGITSIVACSDSHDNNCEEDFHKLISSPLNVFLSSECFITQSVFALPLHIVFSKIYKEKHSKLYSFYLLFPSYLRAPPKFSF